MTVLKNTRGVVARIRGRASSSRDDFRWYSVTANTREGSLNPERGTGGSWDDSRWCSVNDKSFYTRSPFLFIAGVINPTSDLAAASALMACKRLSSGCDGICVAGV